MKFDVIKFLAIVGVVANYYKNPMECLKFYPNSVTDDIDDLEYKLFPW